MIVKLLKLLLGEKVTKIINKHINRDLPGYCAPLTPWSFVILGI